MYKGIASHLVFAGITAAWILWTAYLLGARLTVGDNLALAGVLVSLWQAIVARLEAAPAGELSRRELQRQLKLENDGLLTAELSYTESGGDVLSLVNCGHCDLVDVSWAIADTNSMQFQTHKSSPTFALIRAGEKALAVRIGFAAGASPNIDVDLKWRSPDGRMHSRTQTIARI